MTPIGPDNSGHDSTNASGPHKPTVRQDKNKVATEASLVCPHCSFPVPGEGTATYCPACGSSFRVERGAPESTIDFIRLMGRFQLFQRVGMGSFGAVWRARDTQLDRVVALKIPHAGGAGDPESARRIEREARAAAQLRHPGIVRLYEVVTIGELPVLVSDFIEGITLKELLKRQRFSYLESARLTADLADALHYAHARGLVHRDIKPGNVMIELPASSPESPAKPPEKARRWDGCRAIIVDFGLALRSEAEVVLTVDGEILGTPAYMSPEQAAGRSHHVDGRSDGYSLGVVFYELLCGETPFRGSKSMILHKVLADEPQSPRRINDKISRDAETVCLKAIAKRPESRYQSCAEFAADLRRLVAGEPIRARPIGASERLWRWCRRNPVLAAALAVALTATVALLIVSIGLNIQQSRALHASRRFSAMAALTHGSEECEQGNIAQGLLWYARGLEEAPRDEEALIQVLRANLAAWYPWNGPVRAHLSHPSSVVPLAYSGDGTRLMTGGDDNIARVWDAQTGAALGAPMPHTERILALALSPDGKRAASSTSDGSVFVWDATSGNLWGSPLKLPKRVRAVAFGGQGRTLAAACDDGNVYVYDVMAREQTPKIFKQSAAARTLAIGSGDAMLIVGTADNKVRCWNVETGQPVHPEFSSPAEVVQIAVGPRPDVLLIGTSDRIVHLWKPATGETLRTFPHPSPLTALAFAPDGQRILTACLDRSLRLWDAATGRTLGPATRSLVASKSALFSPDGRHILAAGDGPGAWIHQVPSGNGRQRLKTPAESIRQLAYSVPGDSILVGTGRLSGPKWSLTICNTLTGAPIGEAVAHPAAIVSAAYSPDGARVATGALDRLARVIDVGKGTLHCPPLEHDDSVWAVSFSPDGKQLLTGSRAGALLWNVSTGALQAAYPHSQSVTSVAFHPTGHSILTGCLDQEARIWSLAGRQPDRAFAHGGQIRSVSFDPAGKVILTSGRNGTARLWDADRGAALGEEMRHQKEIFAAEFGLNGRYVLTGSADATARVWDGKTGLPISAPLSHQDSVLTVSFHPTRFLVLTGCADQSARLWDFRIGKQIGPALTHDGKVNAVAFHPNGKSFATGSSEGMAVLWNLHDSVMGDAQRITLWLQVQTGMTLDEQGAFTFLKPDAWKQQREQLGQLGGPPVPD